MTLVEESRIREHREGRIQEHGTVTVIAFPGDTPGDTLLYLPMYKANPSKRIRENDLGLLSETMRLDPYTNRREAPLLAALRGYREEMNDDLESKTFFIQPGRVFSKMLFDTKKGWDTDVSHVQGHLTLLWTFTKSDFPLCVDTSEMNGAEWVPLNEVLKEDLQLKFRQSPPSPFDVIGKLKSEGFFDICSTNFQAVSWFSKIREAGFDRKY